MFPPMKKTVRHFTSHFRRHGMKYVLWISLLAIAKWVISLALGIGYFSLTAHALYDPATVCNNITDIPQSECYALVNLYNATDGDHRWDVSSMRVWPVPMWGGYAWSQLANLWRLQWTTVCSSRRTVTCKNGHVTSLTVALQSQSGPSASVDLSGLPYLTNVLLSNLNISSIDLSGLTWLWMLDLDGNALTSIDLPLSGTIWYLDLSDNQLDSISLPEDKTLWQLDLNNNHLTQLYIPPTSLVNLNVADNPLTILDATWSVLSNLRSLDLGWTQIALDTIDFSASSLLTYLNLSGDGLSTFSFTGLDSLNQIVLSNNNFSWVFTLDAKMYSGLQTLNLDNNQLVWIDLHDFTSLNWISANNNLLTTDGLDLPESIYRLNLDNNDLSGTWDLSAIPLTNLSAQYNHLTNILLDKPVMERMSLENNDLTTFDFHWFENLQGMWLAGNKFSDTLEDMWACDLPFTGKNMMIDCRNALNGGVSIQWCRRVDLNSAWLKGDIPDCFKTFNDTTINLAGNMLSLYNDQGEIKYTWDLLAWLNDFAVYPTQWNGQNGTANWMNQNSASQLHSDLYILPSISTAWRIVKWSTINLTLDFWNLGPDVALPGSKIVVSFGGLEDIVPSTWTFGTSWWVIGDACYDQFLQGTGVYAQAIDAASEAMYLALGKPNPDGTVTVTLGKGQSVTFPLTESIQNTRGLTRYFNFMAEVLWAMGNTEMKDQIINGLASSWAYASLEYFCNAGVFNNGKWYSTMAECLTSPRAPNMWTPIQLSGFSGCGVSSLKYTVWGLWVNDPRTITVSAKVLWDIDIGASIINTWIEQNLQNNYGYFSMDLVHQKIVWYSGFLYLATPQWASWVPLVVNRAAVAYASGWKDSVEIPADTTITVSGSWDGALYAPTLSSNFSCTFSKDPIKTVSVWATGDNASLLASGWYFQITISVWTSYDDNDLAIYVSNGWPCVLNLPDSSCEVSGGTCSFRAAHLSDFSFIVSGQEWQNSWDNTSWDNTSWDNTSWGITPSVTPPAVSWWGGSAPLVKDVCPASRDCSDSYYDHLCGTCSQTTLLDKIVDRFHKKPVTKSWSIVWSPYSNELNNAYLRAYSLWLTSMPTIQLAKMDGTLLRAHLAKIISQFAVNVLGLKENTWANCVFSDIATQTKEMQYYEVQACRLWLMWVGSASFFPAKEVNRATFGTTLSRALYGNANDTSSKLYYTKHLKALKDAGIMTMITSPLSNEVRWYVLLMLMRTATIVHPNK